MATHIDRIIEQMGYAESSCLKYGRDGFNGTTLSTHYKKILDELAPYAVYCIGNAPFVLFYEENSDKEEQKRINKKIWNAQVPVTITCGAADVRIYSSCSLNREKSTFDEVEHLFVDGVDQNSPFSYWEITSQDFWVKYTKQFSGDKLNDHLLRNLSDITKKLREDYSVDFATKLILRLIFIRYLIDRGVDLDYKGFNSDAEASRDSFLRLLSDKVKLYNLFSHLKEKFNGNLFELDNECAALCLTADVFQVVSDFFSANMDTKTGQLSLFNLYDFNIIPVELISNIYEILLGKENRDRDNAFYTPQYLVDYILDDTVSPSIRENGACKVLDPSCGSGIFLVESYRRMVEKELDGELFTESNELLQGILAENIYGIDLNEDAIDVAIFSLYLAVLDYKNPKTLKKFALPNLKGDNLFVANFFDENALQAIEKIPFSFIVGNPPWGSQRGLLTDYCKHRGYSHLLQNNDACRAFILRSKDFSSTNTKCCFVLHSKMLYLQKSPSQRFREYLLRNTIISRIVELSSVRKLVFKNADAPAVVLTYSFSEDAPFENRFEYISMKPNLFFRLFNIIVVEKTDMKYVPQKVLIENDWMWKTLVYGLSGDIDTILQLKATVGTLNESIEEQQPPLVNIVGLLNSKLYAYFNLMLGSSLQVEREQRHMKEVLAFPFVNSDGIAKQVELIQEMSKHTAFTIAPDVSGEIEKLNGMIFEAFGLADSSFVDYALNVQIPQLTNSKNCRAFQAVNNQQLRIYAKPFLEALSTIFGMSGKYVSANIYPAVTKYYCAVEIVLHDSRPSEEIIVVDEPSSTQMALTRFSAHKVNDMFFALKDVIHFEEDSFYIIKVNYYKNWHPAIAEIDLADVINQILTRNEEND